MTMQRDSEVLQIRFIVAVPRSGSTLLMRICQGAPSCSVTSRLVLQGNYSKFPSFKPDYTIFTSPTCLTVYQQAVSKGSRTLVSKEEFGHAREKGECDYVIIPDAAGYEMTKPTFLFRDPIRVFDSWKNLGWSDVESFMTCYTALYEMHKAHPECYALTYEEIVSNSEKTIKSLCEYMGITYSENMLSFNRPLGDFLYNSQREKDIYTTKSKSTAGIFATVGSHESVQEHIQSHGLLSISEIELIESSLGKMYIDVCAKVGRVLRNLLHEKLWFAFDLDDTLHEFKRASRTASNAVFNAIHDLHHVSVDDLAARYSKILSQKTSGAFADGRTSTEYRRERFTALLESSSIPCTEDFINRLLELYKDTLKQSLQLKPGALQVLQHLRKLGKKTIIITEGPADAQTWTVAALGIAPYVDILVTTNEMGKSKVDGLFAAVLQKFEIEAGEMCFIGDNPTRDVAPARKEGIWSWLYDEKDNCLFDADTPRINSLMKMVNLLGEKA